MPGIDGWETLRRLRALGGAQPQVAIVSANAFDRVLDNSLGIEPHDLCSSRCATANCWTGWSASSIWCGWKRLPNRARHTAARPRRQTNPCHPPRAALLALQEWSSWATSAAS
jgi:CheY-like chemotaxis protein